MLEPGTRIADRYTVLRPLGTGGMGGVFEIEGDALKNRLALKVIRSDLLDNPTVAARFEREARIQSRVDHPGIAKVFDLLRHDGQLAIVMEYIDGPTLRSRMSAGRLPYPQTREIVRDVLRALMAAHDAHVVHRDLKPANIFVLIDRSGRVHCKLIDFGIARQLAQDADTRPPRQLTQAQTFIGTYAYASPEQVEGEPVGVRSDLYSLGVILWEMLAGVHPYAEFSNEFKLQSAVVSDLLPDLPAETPTDLRALVAELTRKDPAERPQTAEEVLSSLTRPAALLDAATIPEGVRAPPALTPSSPSPAQPQVLAKTMLEAPPASAAAAKPAPVVARAESPPEAQLQPGSSTDRFKARVRDEVLPLLLVLTVIGLFFYPFIVLLRGVGMRSGTAASPVQSAGQSKYGLRVLMAETGGPPTRSRVLVRNGIDLVLIQFPLALAVWPPAAVVGSFILVGFWLTLFIGLEAVVAASNPQRRRIVDMICGTRVCRVASP